MLVLPGVLLGSAGTASAQLLVKDPFNLIYNLLQAKRYVDEVRKYAPKKFKLSDYVGSQRQYERVFRAGLGYANPELARVYRQHFPQSILNDPLLTKGGQQRNALRDAAFQVVKNVALQNDQISDAKKTLEDLRDQVKKAKTSDQIAQSQAAVEALAVEEAMQSRQAQIAVAQMQANVMLQEVDAKRQEAERDVKALREHDKREDRLDAMLDSIHGAVKRSNDVFDSNYQPPASEFEMPKPPGRQRR